MVRCKPPVFQQKEKNAYTQCLSPLWKYICGLHSHPHLEFALSEECAELSDALSSYGISAGLVLGHLILQGDEADGGALLLLQAKELQDALVVIHVTVDVNEQDLDRSKVINIWTGNILGEQSLSMYDEAQTSAIST